MEPGPLPPHERAWRHPSELAAEERNALRSETPSPSGHTIALTAGLLGLLALGALMLVVTPPGRHAPIAITATTTPSVALGSSAVSGVRSPVSTPGSGMATATPIGEGRFAVMTRAATPATTGSRLDVVVPSGEVVAGQIVHDAGNALVVELATPVPGHDLAERWPDGEAIVTVLSEPPVTVALANVVELDVGEGTAVLDEDGALLGLCSRDVDSGEQRVVDVSAGLGVATSDDR